MLNRPAGRVLRLSPTAVASFNECPRQYKLRYIDHLDEYGGPRPYFTMGNHIHDTLREFLTTVPLEDRNLETALGLLRKNWRRYRVGFRGPEDERRWAQKAVGQLSSFISRHDTTIRPYMVEARLETLLTPGVFLHSRIDRLDLLKDGTLHIIDYKTGNVPATRDWTQLNLNALAASRTMTFPVSRVSFIYLSSGSMDTAYVGQPVLDQTRWDILVTARAISSGKSFHPRPGSACRRCDFRPVCAEGKAVKKRAVYPEPAPGRLLA